MSTGKPSHGLRRIGIHVLVVLAVALGGLVATSAPASASCSHGHSNLDVRFDIVSGAGSLGLALRTGPHTGCGLIRRLPNGSGVDLHCFVHGDNVFGLDTWSYVRYNPGGQDWFGWVSDYYLQDGGSFFHC
jgi:hypothetical protein